MKHLNKILALTLILTFTSSSLIGCNTSLSEKNTKEISLENSKQYLYNEYKDIIQNDKMYPSGEYNNQKDNKLFRGYSLVKLKNSDKPILLICVGNGKTTFAKIYYPNDDNLIKKYNDIIILGDLQESGNNFLATDKTNTNLYYIKTYNSEIASANKYILKNNKIDEQPVDKYENNDGLNNYKLLNWSEKSSLNLLKKEILKEKVSVSDYQLFNNNPFNKKIKNNDLTDKAKKNSSQATNVIDRKNDILLKNDCYLNGTIKILSPREILEFQKENLVLDFIASQYAVFILDNPKDITCSFFQTGLRKKYVSIIGLSDNAESIDLFNKLKKYNGKKVTLYTKYNNLIMPTDASLPLGQPFCNNVNIYD